MSEEKNSFFKSQVLGHPSGLFVLFFTEMWERFSFYGMRVLLVNFLTMALIGTNPGWEWTQENAMALFGSYAGLLYLTPVVGGILADKVMGYRKAVFWGALIMFLGHFSMAFETEASLYIGLALLVIGTGLFKPNMSSIVSEMYKDLPEKKDGGYTIFYMGVNAGAFFGMMLCGYLAEKVGWSYGFGLAGIFMLLGMFQFLLAKPLFGNIGAKPNKEEKKEEVKEELEKDGNPFTILDKILAFAASAIGLLYLLNDPFSKIAGIDLLPAEFLVTKDQVSGGTVIALIGVLIFLVLITMRIIRYVKDVRNKMIAVVLFAFFTIFFWMAFEQGASTLVIFARDFTQRVLEGGAAQVFFIVDLMLTFVPLLFITYVIWKLVKETSAKIMSSNIVLIISFVLVWAIAIWKVNKDLGYDTYVISVDAIELSGEKTVEKAGKDKIEKVSAAYHYTESGVDANSFIKGLASYADGKPVKGVEKTYNVNIIVNDSTSSLLVSSGEVNEVQWDSFQADIKNNVAYEALVSLDSISGVYDITLASTFVIGKNEGKVVKVGFKKDSLSSIVEAQFEDGQEILVLDEKKIFNYLDEEKESLVRGQLAKYNKEHDDKRESKIIAATVLSKKDSSSIEITASWFSILNSFFIIALANLISKWWESKYNPSAAYKYGYGLIIMAIGFAVLAIGAGSIPSGSEAGVVRVSLIWLVLAYLFHTIGELCLSPVGLSYVSKLVPARMIAFMFGMWYLAIAIGNKLAHVVGGMGEEILRNNSWSYFFWIFTIIPVVAGVLVILLNKPLKKLMGDVR